MYYNNIQVLDYFTKKHSVISLREAVTHNCNCDSLCDLVPFVQFKKCEKYPWRSVTFTITLLKITLLQVCLLCFLNHTNGSKSCNASQLCFKSKIYLIYVLLLSLLCRIFSQGWSYRI